jgi:hypothetical protein
LKAAEMKLTFLDILDIGTYIPFAAFLGWGLYRKYVSSKPVPAMIAIPIRALRVLLIIITFGLLGSCANKDPLAVASGPVFALNVGHWQPTPQDLTAPPAVVKQ